MFANAEDVQADPIGELYLIPVAGSEMPAAKLSIPICIYVTSPRQLSFRLIGTLRRYVNVGLNTLD
jgi:hypothetical protein